MPTTAELRAAFPQRLKLIRKLAKQGYIAGEIARRVGCSRERIRQIGISHGVDITDYRELIARPLGRKHKT